MPRAASNRVLARVARTTGRGVGAGRGIILSQGRVDSTVAWVRRGVGAVTVASLDGWTVAVPTGPAYARFPYDDAVRSLAGRPVGMRMRPALGIFRLGRQIVITVHPQRWRAMARWLIWTPRDGLVPPRGLPAGTVADVVALVHSTVRLTDPDAAVRRLDDVLGDGTRDPEAVLSEVFAALALPGLDILTGDLAPADLPGAREVSIRARHARAFDRIVTEERRQLMEGES